MQYLIKTITHDTGEVFHDVVKAKENEVFTLVDAESEDEALKRYRFNKLVKRINNTLKNNKLLQAIREDSE
jgi:meiotically up-regulated gene 157 (Mug157) protein